MVLLKHLRELFKGACLEQFRLTLDKTKSTLSFLLLFPPAMKHHGFEDVSPPPPNAHSPSEDSHSEAMVSPGSPAFGDLIGTAAPGPVAAAKTIY